MSYQLFYIGTRAVIVKEKKVLLLKKEDDTGILWDMPGGRIDEDEWDMKVALQREVEEELPGVGNRIYRSRHSAKWGTFGLSLVFMGGD